MAIGTGIAVDGGAGPAGNARQRFQTLQTAIDREIDQTLQFGSGAGRDAVSLGAERVAAVAQHQAAIAAVGNNQIGAAADYHHRNARAFGRPQRIEKGRLRAGLRVQIGRPSHAETGMPR